MNQEQMEALAEYLTGMLVAHHSINLGIGGPNAIAAKEYFNLRAKFGVKGYANKQEAMALLQSQQTNQSRNI